MVLKGKLEWRILVILLLVTCLVYGLHIHLLHKSKTSKVGNEINLPPKLHTKLELDMNSFYKMCNYVIIFNETEIDGICAPYPPGAVSPVCSVVRIDHLNQSDFRTARLNAVPAGGQALSVFVHPDRDLISNSIVNSGNWDAGSVGRVMRVLASVPGAALVDIGCNVGVFSLAAAQIGRRVVSIDANYQNAIRLRKSVLTNSFADRVHIYWNALEIKPGALHMRLPLDCNVGGGFPTETLQTQWYRDPLPVRTVGLDELLLANPLLANVSDLIVKIDIEGCEWEAMSTAGGTFARYHIPLILMEWRGTELFRADKAEPLLKLFAERNYTAYDMWEQPPVVLKPEDHKKWPRDVLWLRGNGGHERDLLDRL